MSNCTSHWASGISQAGGSAADHAGGGDGGLQAPEMRDGLIHRRPHVCCAADIAHHGAHVGAVAPGHLLQVGLRGEGIVEGRVVGGEVHRHHLPATVHQQVHRRRAHAAAPRR